MSSSKKVLVTGANGMLGLDLVHLLEKENFTVIATDINNLDITDERAVEVFLNEHKPDFVIHAAAYTNVDKAEEEQEKAFLINQKGAENIAKYSAFLNIPIFYMSTDYVFDGTKDEPYEPLDAPNPINVYGLSKFKGEETVKNYNSKHYIIRTSWLYGKNGKNFVETIIKLAQEKAELRVVSNQFGCPTWTTALAHGIIEIIKKNKDYGIYHICGSSSTSWHGFAEKIVEFAGLKARVIPVSTEEFPRPAKRPKYSVMNNNNSCPNWEKSLKEYIELRKN